MALVTGGALAAAVSRAGGLGVVGGAYAGTIAKVEFENDRIRVLRVHYEPHEKMDMHEHPATVVVTLTRTHTRATLPDGTSKESRSEPGTVTWTEPERHAVENLSDEPMEDFEIELKRAKAPAVAVSPPPSGSTTPMEPMPASLEPHHHIKYQNQYIRVFRGNARTGRGLVLPHAFHGHLVRYAGGCCGESTRAKGELGAGYRFQGR